MKVDFNFLTSNFMEPITGVKKDNGNGNIFSDLLSSISKQEHSVGEMKTEYLNGERDDIDNILIEGQKLNLQLNYALEVRNNLVDMVKQMQNMQI